MSITNSEVRRILIISIILSLFVLSFLVLKPILLSIFTGLVLAFAFMPIYRLSLRVFRFPTLNALIVCTIAIIVFFIPLWFIIPILMKQTFDLFLLAQKLDLKSLILVFFPNLGEQFQAELIAIMSSFITKITAGILTYLTEFLLNLPVILLHFTVILFVMFFTMRDSEKLREYARGLSPFKKEKEKVFAKQFKEVTSSIIYGYIIVGIVQGIAAGIGFFIFGVPNAIVLTILAIFSSILPMIGPWLIWIPVALYLFSTGDVSTALGFTIYSAIFVSMIDNLLRPYIISRKTGVSTLIVMVGMIGGLLVFGMIGLILGPLILSYLIVFLTAYKDKALGEFFTSE